MTKNSVKADAASSATTDAVNAATDAVAENISAGTLLGFPDEIVTHIVMSSSNDPTVIFNLICALRGTSASLKMLCDEAEWFRLLYSHYFPLDLALGNQSFPRPSVSLRQLKEAIDENRFLRCKSRDLTGTTWDITHVGHGVGHKETPLHVVLLNLFAAAYLGDGERFFKAFEQLKTASNMDDTFFLLEQYVDHHGYTIWHILHPVLASDEKLEHSAILKQLFDMRYPSAADKETRIRLNILCGRAITLDRDSDLLHLALTLEIAAQCGRTAIIEQAMRDKMLQPDTSSFYALFSRAAFYGSAAIVLLLLERSQDKVVLLKHKNITGLDNRTALQLAVTQGNTAVTQVLLAAAEDANIVEELLTDNYTVLCLAAANGYLDVVKDLLAAAKKYVNILDKLLNTTIRIPYRDPLTPLCLAAENGYLDVVKALLAAARGANLLGKLFTVTGGSWATLHYAAAKGKLDIGMVKTLLAAATSTINLLGESSTAKESCSWTVLHVAIDLGQLTVLEALLAAAKKDTNILEKLLTAPGRDIKITLHHAAAKGQLDAVMALLAAATEGGQNLLGKILTATDITGQTALHVATAKGHEEIAKMLCKALFTHALLQYTTRVESYPKTEKGFSHGFTFFPKPRAISRKRHCLVAKRILDALEKNPTWTIENISKEVSRLKKETGLDRRPITSAELRGAFSTVAYSSRMNGR